MWWKFFYLDFFPILEVNVVTLKINTGIHFKNLDLKIYTLLGGMAKQLSLSTLENEFKIDTAGLNTGIYFCKLTMNGAEKVKKLIIQH